MTASRRDLEDAARRRFGPGLASGCEVYRCDRPGMAFDVDDNFKTICLLHMLERVGLIASFPAYASLPSKVVPQRACEICGEPATHELTESFKSVHIESGQGGGHETSWPVCGAHRTARPIVVQDERGVRRTELSDGDPPTSVHPRSHADD